MLIKKYIKITIQNDTAKVDDNLYFYKNDKNIDVYFEIINFKFDFIKNETVGENLTTKTNDEYNKHLRVPLFATADFANYAKKFGVKLPSQMALGATDDEELAYKAGKEGGLATTILNGANEEAVALLLEEKIKFLQIAEIVEESLEYFKNEKTKEVTLENIIDLDEKVREYIRNKWC